tara:strand:+ start:33444 stop:34655 length:1212 start_codon:yes stop_codon:yes gene_type:complete
MPNQKETKVRHFARVRFRIDERLFGIKHEDRFQHTYIVGKTGTGKTTLLETLIAGDLADGHGCAILDPHGDLAERVFENAKALGREDIVYLDPADPACAFAYNPLAPTLAIYRPLVAASLLEVFRMMWSDAWGSRMEHVLRMALLALLDQPKASLPDILILLTSASFRKSILPNIKNDTVKRYWQKEFPKYSYRYQADAIAPIQSKVGALLADPRLLRFFTDKQGQLRLRRIMDGRQVFIINLAKGRLGADSSRLVGGVLATMLALAAFSRASLPEAEREAFFVYIDEFQNFTTLAIAQMLSELRKYRLGLIMAHQYFHQLDDDIRRAALGNAGTLIAFRVGAEDAAYLAKEFEPKFDRLDLLNLANHNIYLRLMTDGAPSKPFSARTILPASLPDADEKTSG